MPTSTPEAPPNATTVNSPSTASVAVVEAANAEDALREVHRLHGSDARIVQAEKVLRGGIGGFFQREVVQLTVDVEAATVTTVQRPLRTSDVHHPSVGQRFVSAVQQAMAADEAAGGGPTGETFAELLDRAVGPQAADGTVLTPPSHDDERPSVRIVPAPSTTAGTAAAGAGAGIPAAVSPPTAVVSAIPAVRPSAPATGGGLDGALAMLAAAEEQREASSGAGLRARVGTVAATNEHLAPERATERDARAPDWRAAAVAGPGAAWAARLPQTGEVPLPRAPESPVRPTSPPADLVAEARRALDQRLRMLAATEPEEAAPVVETRPLREAPSLPTVRPTVTATRRARPVAVLAPDDVAACDRMRDRLRGVTATPSVTAAPAADASPAGAWSGTALRRLGLPAALVAEVEATCPGDEVDWFTALAAAVRPRCAARTAERVVLVGPDAALPAARVDARAVRCGEAVPPRGDLVVVGPRERGVVAWLRATAETVRVEVVAGGGAWRGWLFEAPDAVTFADDHFLPDALAAAHELGVPLGHRVHDGVRTPITPLDVAVGVRRLLEAGA
jgi:hypothetical protein